MTIEQNERQLGQVYYHAYQHNLCVHQVHTMLLLAADNYRSKLVPSFLKTYFSVAYKHYIKQVECILCVKNVNN
jgi:hypothetical protein